jgi:L-iditol 2-dehydrogenase/galactitol-1-phosphate 5-dehydrogenase
MNALVLEDQRELSYREVPEPEQVGARPVRVRVGAAGVCASDLHRYNGKAYRFPLVLGHEFSAIVEEVPPACRFKPGDRVAVFPLLPNYDDPYAQIGEYAVSDGYDYFGSRRDGGFAERRVIPEANLIPLPDHVSLLEGACVEPAAVALHAIQKLGIPVAAVGLVIGAGPIGAFAAQWLRRLGGARVIVAEIDPRKREIMERLGCETVDAGNGNTPELVRNLTDGHGADCVVEASGIPKAFLQSIEAAATFGQVMFLGDVSGDVTLTARQVSSILRRELRLYGTWNSKITPPGRSEWDMVAREIASGAIDARSLISHAPTLETGVRMFAEMAARSVWFSKVVFAVSEEAREEAKALDGPARAYAHADGNGGARPAVHSHATASGGTA